MAIVPVSRLDDVLKAALVRTPEPITWDETAETQAVPPDESEGGSRPVAH